MEIQGYSAFGIGSFTGLLNSESNQGVSLNTEIDSDNEVTSAFAQDIVLRLQSAASEDESTYGVSDTDAILSNAGGIQGLQLDGEGTDAQELGDSLARAVDFIRENFGDEAASATIGLVYQSIGDGAITEDNLGEGLVSAVKLIDSNFGFAAGDQVMSYFNSDINDAMNSYFDNGLMEEFYASTSSGSDTGSSSLPQSITTAIGQIAEETDEETASSLMEILTSSLEENGKSLDSMKSALQEAQAYLNETQDSETAASLGATLSQGLAQSLPDAPMFQAMNQQGALLDITV